MAYIVVQVLTLGIARAQEYQWYIPGAIECSDSAVGGVPIEVGDIPDAGLYIVGDSLTNGMRAYLETLFGPKISGEIEATDGDTMQAALAKISVSATVKVALVGLGTNNYLESDQQLRTNIQNIVTKIRGGDPNGPVVIYWVNIYAPRADIISEVPRINAVISSFAASDTNFKVIDWATEAQNGTYTFPDQLHPAQYEQRARFIYEQLVTGSTLTDDSQVVTPSGTSFTVNFGSTPKTLPTEWIPILGRAAERMGVDPSILAALLAIETGWDTPESFAANPRRNSATATGPFQFVDQTALDFLPAPDVHAVNQNPGSYTNRVARQINNGSEREADGTYLFDGNKDGVVDRANPDDAAYMAAAYLKLLGAGTSTPLGTAGDYKVPTGARGDALTVRIVGAYYNQGPGFSAPNAQTAEQVNAFARGGNNVAKYMDRMMEITDAGRKSGVFVGDYGDGGIQGDCREVNQGVGGNVDVSGYSFPLEPQTQAVGGIRVGQTTTTHHDGTPAFDLFSTDSANVYAIYGGTVTNVRTDFNDIPGCSSIQLHADDGFYYWYGHLKNPTVQRNSKVTAGQQIAQIADARGFDTRCWGGGPHLHIDRGCTIAGVPQTGGRDECRDPEFIPFLSKLYETLPQ